MAHPEPSRVFGVCLVLTRALQNRGPEEFTLQTASGGESNLKLKKQYFMATFYDFTTKLSQIFQDPG